ADVVVRRRPLPEDDGQWAHRARRFRASPNRWFFESSEGCRFLVEHGRDVTVDAARVVSPDAVVDGILQPVLAAIFHQRDIFALHASAVEGPGGIVAFFGERAAGKSTLAAWLRGRGYGFVADDICPIDAHGRPVVHGGFAYQKLSPESIR